MFTGIVEELGTVVAVTELTDSRRLTFRGPGVTADAAGGDSIAVNGVCLTVVGDGPSGGEFSADVMGETLARTTLGSLAVGDRVNLERPMVLGDRLDGHLVQGHVDGTVAVRSRTPHEDWEVVAFDLPEDLARYVVHKGSIALDGTSLTVSAVIPDTFEVSLIPTTLEKTTLGLRQVGERVNVEVDVIAKYVERLLGGEADRR